MVAVAKVVNFVFVFDSRAIYRFVGAGDVCAAAVAAVATVTAIAVIACRGGIVAGGECQCERNGCDFIKSFYVVLLFVLDTT